MKHWRRGFTLVEMAVVIMLAGLIAGIVLTASATTDINVKYDASKERIAKVDQAIARYVMQHDRLPLPARRNVGVESKDYGREVALADIGDLDVVSGVAFGALPFQTLGIPVESATDSWGNKLTYAVTIDMTDSTKYLDDTVKGKISIKTNGGSDYLKLAMYAIISHGHDELGAVKANYSGIDKKWCPVTSELRSQNCNPNDTELADADYNDGKNAGAAYFDDIIVFKAKPEPPVNGGWSLPNACHDGPCGGVGIQELTCTNPPPSNGGADCPGAPAAATQNCMMPACAGGGGGGGSCTPNCAGNATWGGGCQTNPNKCPGFDMNVPVISTAPFFSGSATVSCVGGTWAVAPGSTCTEYPACGADTGSANVCANGTAQNASNMCEPTGQHRSYTWDCNLMGWVGASFMVINSVPCSRSWGDAGCP